MNRIYKVVWSKVKHAYVVVSELAPGYVHGTAGTGRYKTAMMALVACLCIGGSALAAPATNPPGEGPGIAIGTGSNAPKEENVAVGKGATIKYSNGASNATGDVAVGSGAVIDNYASQGGSIAIGKNAKINNMTGKQESLFALGQTTYHSGNFWGTLQIPDNPENVAGSIAIGDNTYARTGSVMIGSHNYRGNIGDQSVDTSDTSKYGININATTLGTNSFNQGAFSTVNGAYSIISGKYDGGGFSSYAGQNFGATITGSLNSIESATASSKYSGVANSIVGTANRAFNSNGSLIFGAGNEITNSVTNINAPSSGGASAKDLADTLRSAVRNSESGGSTLAIGGGNKADYTQKTSIIGVNNTVTGTGNRPSTYNFITGFKNDVENVEHVSVIGSNNIIKGSATDPVKNVVVVGDNRTVNEHADGTVVIGSHDAATARSYNTTNAANMVLIGTNANVQHTGGVQQWSGGHVAIGNNSYIENYVNQGGSIAVGQNSHVQNMTGSTEATFIMNQYETKTETDTGGNTIQIATDVQKMSGGIAIGENAYARTGSLMLGTHKYTGQIGDTTVDTSDAAKMAAANQQMNATILGTNSFGNGAFATVTGAYSIISGDYAAGRWRNLGAGITGSLNTIESQTATEAFAGVATNVLGTANRTFNTNGALVLGSGNEVTNSIAEIELPNTGTDYASSAKGVAEKLRGAIKTAKGGGAVVTVGDANTVDYVRDSQVVGSNNTVTGTAAAVSTQNALVGSSRKLTGVSRSVVIGSADSEMETTVSNATILGHNANVQKEGGVALGARSVSAVDAGVAGYDPSIKAASTDTSSVWKATEAAVSVGDATKHVTRQITGVAAGSEDTDAVNVAQLKKVEAKAEAAKTNVTAGDNVTVAHDSATNTYKVSAKDTYTTGGTYDAATKKIKFAQNDPSKNYEVDVSGLVGSGGTGSLTFAGDTGSAITKNSGETLQITGGATGVAAANNIGVVSENGKLNLKLAKNIDLGSDGSMKTGNTKIDNAGLTIAGGPSVTKDGIDAGSKKITHVAAGEISAASTDAVNGSQLHAVKNDIQNITNNVTNIGGKVNKLDTRVNRVGAGAAALAALHPLDFNPDDKWDFAVGYGNYKDAHAVAVGAFYRPNEDTMFSVGGSLGGGENMVNAGLSVKLGQGNGVSTSKVAMAKEIVDLKDAVTRLEAQNEQFRQIIGQMAGKHVDVDFPDVPKDHWAYQYVKSLADRGLLEGYPDGEFKGDRSMTRYEFAAIIYRALQNGAPVDGNMGKAMDEFGPEIEKVREAYRFRVDRVSGGDSDRHKVERVRVNNEDHKDKNEYRDVYGSHISPEAK